MPKNHNSGRYAELDVFRGLAILSVLLFHYTTRYDQIYGHPVMPFSFPYGNLGVELFFMISGFVIYMSLRNIKNKNDFFVNRFSKLYPAYWTSIVITFCVVEIFTLPGRQATLPDALINLSMLQEWIRGVKHVDGAYWTLSRFIVFYFIVFLIYKFDFNKKIITFCITWLLLIVIAEIAGNMGLKIPFKVRLMFLLKEGSFFILGITFYRLKKYGNQRPLYLIILCCLVSIYFVNGITVFIASLLFSSLFFLFSFGYLEFITIKPLTWIGGISYSLYLVHQNIGFVIINKLKTLDIHFAFLIIIPTAVSLSIAAIITYYIEKPALRMIRSKISNSGK